MAESVEATLENDQTRTTPLTDDELQRLTTSMSELPLATGRYRQPDFILNLFLTVLDYRMRVDIVNRAIERFRLSRWDEIRTADDLCDVLDRFPDGTAGNRDLAIYLWGYRYSARAHQLRVLLSFLAEIGATDQESLTRWAASADFKRNFRGRVPGLGLAVFQALRLRLGFSTSKPDVWLHRYFERCLGRPVLDVEIIDAIERAAPLLAVTEDDLDRRIWESERFRGRSGEARA